MGVKFTDGGREYVPVRTIYSNDVEIPFLFHRPNRQGVDLKPASVGIRLNVLLAKYHFITVPEVGGSERSQNTLFFSLLRLPPFYPLIMLLHDLLRIVEPNDIRAVFLAKALDAVLLDLVDPVVWRVPYLTRVLPVGLRNY